MNGKPSPLKLYFRLVAAGFVLGMTLTQLLFVLAGKIERKDTSIVIGALVSVLLLTFGWRSVKSAVANRVE